MEAATYPEQFDGLIAIGVGADDELAENLRVGPLKVIADDLMDSRAAHCIAPYPNPLPGYPDGKPNHTRSGLLALLGRAREIRLQATIHAIGDAACHDVLSAFKISGMRGSIEHVQCVVPADLSRFVRPELVMNIQPAYQPEDIGVVEQVWPGAGDRTYPVLDLLHAGARLALGSGAPMASLDPWEAIEAACHRLHRADQASVPPVTLRASTRITLSVGQLADLVLTTDPGEVLLTMLGSQIIFGR